MNIYLGNTNETHKREVLKWLNTLLVLVTTASLFRTGFDTSLST